MHVNRLLQRWCQRYSYTITTLTMQAVGLRGYSDRLLGKGGWQEQAGIGHHGVVVKDNAEYGI